MTSLVLLAAMIGSPANASASTAEVPISLEEQVKLPATVRVVTARARITDPDCAAAVTLATAGIQSQLDRGATVLGVYPAGVAAPPSSTATCKMLGKASKPEGATVSFDVLLGDANPASALPTLSRERAAALTLVAAAARAGSSAPATNADLNKLAFAEHNGRVFLDLGPLSTKTALDRQRYSDGQRMLAVVDDVLMPSIAEWQPLLGRLTEVTGALIDVQVNTHEAGKKKRRELLRFYVPTRLAGDALAGRASDQAFIDGITPSWSASGKAASLAPLAVDAEAGTTLPSGSGVRVGARTTEPDVDDLLAD